MEDEKLIYKDYYVVKPNGEVSIHHAGLIDFLGKSGFMMGEYNGGNHLLRAQNNILKESSIAEAIKFIDEHISQLPKDLGYGASPRDLRNLLVRGSKTYFEKQKFEFLPWKQVIINRDSKDEAFFYYKNGYAMVTAESVTVHPYKALKNPIWYNQIKMRDFSISQMETRESVIQQFLFNVSGRDELRYNSLGSLMGFLMHNYKDLSIAKVVVLVDQEIGELGTANGGTGKSIITQALMHMLNAVLIPGKNFDISKSFAFQRVGLGTDLIVIDDAKKNESLEPFYNVITEGITVERKHKGEYFIPFLSSPKLIITTNYVLKSPEGNSSERRQKIWEAAPFYNKDHQPEKDFGHNLFQDWDAVEWKRFDNAMLGFVQSYLRSGIIEPPKINITLRKLISEAGPEFVEFMDDKIREGTIRFHKKDTHEEFVKTYPDIRKFYASTNKFTTKMKRYFDDKQISFIETPANTKKYFELQQGSGPETASTPSDSPKEVKVTPEPMAPNDSTIKLIESNGMRTLKDVPHSYHLVDTEVKRAELIALLMVQRSIAFDTETTDFNVHPIEIVGLSVSFNLHEAYYVPFPKEYSEAKKILGEFREVFESDNIEKIAHNLKYDMQILRNYNVPVRGPVFDTMIAHYLCFPDGQNHGLKPLCEEFFNYRQVHYEDIVGKGKDEKSIHEVPLAQLAEYASEDADFTFQLKLKLVPMLKDRGLIKLFQEVEMPLVFVLADVESEGVKVDSACLNDLLKKADVELAQKEKSIYGLAGEEFKIGSAQQLNRILFDKLEIKPTGKKGKSGYYSVNSEALQNLSEDNLIVPLIKGCKELSSIRANFFLKLPRMVVPLTGRVHTKYNQAIASTGRLSSSQPNLQNVPKKRDGLGSLVRSAFVPRDPDHVIISADYSQIELRVVAHMSGDMSLTNAFLQGLDVHSATAAKIFNVPIEDITKSDFRRQQAKSINFGLNYGMTEFGLAKRLSIDTGIPVSNAEAREVIDTYFQNFVGVKRFMDQAVYDATNKGYAETLYSRRRELSDINSNDPYKRSAAKRIAVNTPIQGTAADIIKMAMINVHQELLSNNMKTKMIMQIHDELVFDAPKAELERALVIIRSAMENVVTLSVPLLVDIGHGESWLAAH